MGGTDAQDNIATRVYSYSALLDHPYLVSIVSEHTWNGLQLQLVDRAPKRDRLTNAPAPAKNGPKSHPLLERAGKQVPMGCDRAFSSMSSRQFSTLFGRSLV
jgi:hypothetical protein